MRKPKILVVGSLVMDLIVITHRFPNAGETVLGENYTTVSGGKGANQAVQAARLGMDVTMVGKVGADPFGAELLESVRSAGVHTQHILQTSLARSAVGNVQIEARSKQNRIVVIPGANMTITPENIAFLKDEIAAYDMVLLQLEIPMEINCLVAQYAAAKGVPVMLNCAPIAPMPPELLQNVTYLSPNEHEARILTGIAVNDSASTLEALDAIRAMGVENALITLGDRGAICKNSQGIFSGAALDQLDVQDTTAAGDSFIGAFCTGVALGMPMDDALMLANHTAALTVCGLGAQSSLPTREQVLTLMRSRGVDMRRMLPLMALDEKE